MSAPLFKQRGALTIGGITLGMLLADNPSATIVLGCLECGADGSPIRVDALVARFGERASIQDIASKSRCKTCGGKP
ncbi:MAG: hypothetical protein AAFQ35_07350 [Pseudomonadota bacterium]